MFEVMWQEFNRRAKIVTKRKIFKSQDAMNKFIEKLYDKDNYWQLVGYREV